MSDSGNSENTRVRIEWYVPENLPVPMATNVVAQHTPHEFVISFFRIMPPLVTGTPDEQREQLKQLESIQAECVARVVIPSGRMPEVLAVLQENYQNYLSKYEQDNESK